MNKLNGKKVAILSTDGFEQSELMQPLKRLKDENATVHIVSLKTGSIKGWKDGNWGDTIKVDKTVDQVSANDYDALVLPGGVINPDILRRNDHAINFTKTFMRDGKPVCAICHGPQLLIETGMIKGRHMTSYDSIKTDLQNAGVNWKDSECVTDQGLVTSRNPGDLDAFCDKMVEEIKEGVHEEAVA